MRLRRARRSPFAYWLAAAALAGLTGLVAARLVGQAAALADRYGPLRPVVVAARPLGFGSVVGPADVAVRRVPATFLPDGALSSVAELAGRTVVVPVLPGLPVVAGHVAPAGLGGIAALLPPGTRAVAVPHGDAVAPLARGDVVDVLVTLDPAVAPGAEPTFAVATDALVVDVGERSATVAVGPEEAKRVAFAVAQGAVTLAVVAPLSGSSTPAARAPPPQPPPGRPRTA